MVIFIFTKAQQFNIINFLYTRHTLFDRILQAFVSERGWSHCLSGKQEKLSGVIHAVQERLIMRPYLSFCDVG